jgi:hypothetical protein
MDPIAGGLGDADTDFLQQNQIIELYVTSKKARVAHVDVEPGLSMASAPRDQSSFAR